MIDEEYDVIIKGEEFKTLETIEDIINSIVSKIN
jgi:acyl carrier protein